MELKYLVFSFFLPVGFLFSTTATWNGPNPGDWNNSANWTPNTAFPNASGDIANLNSATVPANPLINLNVPIIVGTINFDLGTNYTINPMGGFLTLQNPSGSAFLTVTTVNGNGAHTITAPTVLENPLVVTQNSTGIFTIGPGPITEGLTPQSITKTGTGTLVLSGLNMYSGGTIINQGTVSITADFNLGNGGNVTIGNGTLQFNASFGSARSIILTGGASIDVTLGNTATISGVISGVGSLTKSNAGTLVLTSPTGNTYQGGTLIGAGILRIANDNLLGNASGSLTIASATLETTASITSSRSGSFSGAAIIHTGAGNTDSFSGNFSGVGSLTVQGMGTLSLTGTNSYSGGTFVNIGTALQGNTNGLQGNITLNTATSPLTFTQNFNGTYSGVITGPATLTKNGTGTVQFTGNSAGFTGPTNITAGTLNVNGSLANSTLVTVSNGATLSGAGTVGPTTNSGTIDPGNGTSVGTLSINGALTLNGTSTVNISIAPLSADQIAVAGAATINGALNIEPTPGFYGFGVCYPILTSTGLVLAPGFGPITSSNASFIPTVSYSATDVNLCVQILEPFAVFPFSNANTEAVGNNIDAIYAAGQLSTDLRNVFDTLVGQSFSLINDALDQMHPAPYSALVEMQTEIGGQLISLFHRMPYLACGCSNPNRFWLEPFGNTLTLKRHGMQIGSQTNSGGIALGYDGEVAENFVLGIGGAWNKSNLEWYDHRGHATVNGFYGGLYGDYLIGQFYLGAAILGGVDFYNTDRHIQFLSTDRHATSNHQAVDIMAQLAMAYLFGSPYAFFYPYGNFDFLYLHTHKFSEKGANGLNLTVQNRTDSTLRSELGLALQVQDKNAAETICISPKISIGWVNLCPIERPLYKSTFEGASIPFAVQGWDETWNLLNVDFGLAFAYRCSSLRLDYNVELSPDSKTLLYNQHGNIRFDFKW